MCSRKTGASITLSGTNARRLAAGVSLAGVRKRTGLTSSAARRRRGKDCGMSRDLIVDVRGDRHFLPSCKTFTFLRRTFTRFPLLAPRLRLGAECWRAAEPHGGLALTGTPSHQSTAFFPKEPSAPRQGTFTFLRKTFTFLGETFTVCGGTFTECGGSFTECGGTMRFRGITTTCFPCFPLLAPRLRLAAECRRAAEPRGGLALNGPATEAPLCRVEHRARLCVESAWTRKLESSVR